MGYIEDFVSELAVEGKRIINIAFTQANYNKTRTQNLHDSYGSAVFLRGSLVESSISYLAPSAKKGVYNKHAGEIQKGKDEIAKFFKNYESQPTGIELVVAVAMFYGEYLEEGTHHEGGSKWKVISMATDEMEKLQKGIPNSQLYNIRRGKRL